MGNENFFLFLFTLEGIIQNNPFKTFWKKVFPKKSIFFRCCQTLNILPCKESLNTRPITTNFCLNSKAFKTLEKWLMKNDFYSLVQICKTSQPTGLFSKTTWARFGYHLRFCPYTEKYGSKKIRILAYLGNVHLMNESTLTKSVIT